MSNIIAKDRFNIDDIHDIRYKNYEKTKNMSRKELIEHTRREAEYGLMQLEKLRSNKGKRD